MAGLKGFVLAAFLATSLLAAGATTVRADDDDDGDRYHRRWEKRHEQYHRRHDHHRHTPSCRHESHRRPTYGRYDAQCGHILAKAQKAREGLARWEGTGRHRKAVRAWHEVLQKTPQRLAECRRDAHARASRAYDRYDRYDRYDPYDRYGGYSDGYGYGDPYASYGDDGFEWKRDWPLLLGGLFGAYSNP